MVLAAMAEHDFAPSWLKIPSDQQKRGQKLGASDQWSSGNNGGHHDDGPRGRHRHYSSSDSSHPTPSGGYGMSPSMGPPQGGYGYSRGRDPDRRNYPRPGSGSRHHSVDDINGFHDYGGWNMPPPPPPPQYGNGFYSGNNYPRRGGSSPGVRDNLHFGANQHGFGDVFHGGRGGGYYNGRGGSAGRQRYNSGSRSYDDRDGQQKDGGSHHGGDEGHSKDTTAKEGGKKDAKPSALSSNDFPSLLGDNSNSNVNKNAAKTTPAGAWDKPPGAPKVQISGRKVQLIKKSIHNDLPPRTAVDPSTNSSIKSSSSKPPPQPSSIINSEGSKVGGGGQLGSSPRGSRPLSGGSSTVALGSSSSSNNGGSIGGGNTYKPSIKVNSTLQQKTSTEAKDDTSALTASNPKPVTRDSTSHPSKLSPRSPKPITDITTKSSPLKPDAQPIKYNDEKKPLSNTIGAPDNNKTVGDKFDSANRIVSKKVAESKAGPSCQTQPNRNSSRSSAKELISKTVITKSVTRPDENPSIGKQSPNKPVLVAKSIVNKPSSKHVLVDSSTIQKPASKPPSQTKPVLVNASPLQKPVIKLVNKESSSTKPIDVAMVTNSKPAPKHLGGKESPTKPILVDISSSKPTLKPMSVKNANGKPTLKDSPVRPMPLQIKSAKLTGKDSPNRPFPARTSTQKTNGRDRSVRPGPVQIKSTRVTMKDAPMPVNITHKQAAKDNPTTTTSSLFSSSTGNRMQGTRASVHSISTLAKEPLTKPNTSRSSVDVSNPHFAMDVSNPHFAINKNVNNSDHHTRDSFKGLQNGGENWSQNNGRLTIEDAGRMANGPQHSTQNECEVRSGNDSTNHVTTNGLDNDPCHTEEHNLELSSSLEAEKRLLQEMGWHEHSDNEEGYAPITEDEMKEFQRRSQQLKRNGIARSLPATCMSSLPSTPVTSIDLDDALSSCSSDSSDDDS